MYFLLSDIELFPPTKLSSSEKLTKGSSKVEPFSFLAKNYQMFEVDEEVRPEAILPPFLLLVPPLT
jgi:hypothetical protein